jgi:hypothetical protein
MAYGELCKNDQWRNYRNDAEYHLPSIRYSPMMKNLEQKNKRHSITAIVNFRFYCDFNRENVCYLK